MEKQRINKSLITMITVTQTLRQIAKMTIIRIAVKILEIEMEIVEKLQIQV